MSTESSPGSDAHCDLPGQESEPGNRLGCGLPLLAAFWILVICFTVPISADRYRVPLVLKWVITVGHLGAVVGLLFPYEKRIAWTWAVAGLAAAFALLEVAVMWFWN